MYVYTEAQVQNLNTNKQIEVITSSELHCMSSNLFILKHIQGNTQTTHGIRSHLCENYFFKD